MIGWTAQGASHLALVWGEFDLLQSKTSIAIHLVMGSSEILKRGACAGLVPCPGVLNTGCTIGDDSIGPKTEVVSRFDSFPGPLSLRARPLTHVCYTGETLPPARTANPGPDLTNLL